MNARETLKLLRAYESPNITFLEKDGSWPIVWARARGMHVWDAEGKKYLDLTAAFGVAAAGHANARVVKAGQKQMQTLLHAMGDVHPHPLKAKLARELSAITFERWSKRRGRTIFCNSGFEAVEAALKTAVLATGKRKIIAFEGGYHGLGYGALNATHREIFRKPFLGQLGHFADFLPFPSRESDLEPLLRAGDVGAIVVEPVQGRGGIRVPPTGFLPKLRRLCDEYKSLLIVDEIYTGFGRTGRWFACEHSETVPDLVCLGKALAGGFPISACVGSASLIERAWPKSEGEAMHTSTFLGHPVGCAMALAQMEEIKRHKLLARSATMGDYLLQSLRDLRHDRLQLDVRGVGLMTGIEIRTREGDPASALVLRVIKQMLKWGFILLPEGEHGNVIGLTPPLIISKTHINQAVRALAGVLHDIA